MNKRTHSGLAHKLYLKKKAKLLFSPERKSVHTPVPVLEEERLQIW